MATFSSNDVYRLIGINLNEDAVDGSRFTKSIKYSWLKLAHIKIESVITDAIKNNTDDVIVIVFSSEESTSIYRVAVDAYIQYATYLGKLADEEIEVANNVWMAQFLKTIEQLNQRYYTLDEDTFGTTTQTLTACQKLYIRLGVNLGEPVIDGTRFPQGTKYEWFKEAHNKIKPILSEAIKNACNTTLQIVFAPSSGAPTQQFTAYNLASDSYLYYATYLGKLLRNEAQIANDIWLKQFYASIDEINKRFYMYDDAGFSTGSQVDNLYMSIGVNLGEPLISGAKFTKGMKFNWLNQAHNKIVPLLTDSVRNRSSILVVTYFAGMTILVLNVYIDLIPAYIQYVTYLGKLVGGESEVALKVWLSEFYATIKERNEYFFSNTSGLADEIDIFEMDTILMEIGENLGEAQVHGTKITRDMKLRWIGLAQLELSSLLPDDLLIELFRSTTDNTVTAQSEYTVNIGEIDYLVRVEYDHDSNTDLRECKRVSGEEYERIYKRVYIDGNVDLDSDSDYATADNPIYCVSIGVDSSVSSDPEQRLFKIKFLPVPELGNTNAIKYVFMKFPNIIECSVGNWVDDSGITLHRRTIGAIIDYSTFKGKRVVGKYQEAEVWLRDFNDKVKNILRRYGGKVRASSSRFIATPNLLGSFFPLVSSKVELIDD